MPRWQLRAAQATHGLLYVLMIVTPMFGWLYSSASGYSVVYLKLIPLPDLVHKDRHLAGILVQVHAFLAWAIFWIVTAAHGRGVQAPFHRSRRYAAAHAQLASQVRRAA